MSSGRAQALRRARRPAARLPVAEAASARRLRGGALVAAAVILTLTGLLAPAPSRADAAPRPAAPTIELVDQPPWVKGDDEYAVDVRIAGAPPGATVDLVVHDRLESRGQFRDTLEGELGGTEHRVDPRPLASLPSASPGTVRVGFTPDGPSGLGSSGVYPVEVRVLGGDGEPVATLSTYLSFLRSPTPEQPPLEVAAIVDIAAPPALQPDGTYQLSPESRTLARQRIDAVARSGGAAVTLAPLPETIAGMAGVGDGESADVDRLRTLTAGRQVLARPFVDVDLGSLNDAGLDAEANDQAEGGADVVRTHLGTEPAGGVWLSGPTWGADSARQAVALSIDRAVVPPTAVGDGDDDGDQDIPTGPVHLGDENGPLAMVSDPDLAAHLMSDDGIVAAHRFLAELTITWLEEPSVHRGVVVHLPATGALDPEVVGTAFAGLADGQAVRAVPLTQIFAEVEPPEDGPTSLSLAPHDGPDLRSLAPQIRSVRTEVGGVGSLLDDPATGTELEHSLLLSTGTETPADARPLYVAHAEAALRLVEGAVTLPDEFRITLTARSSTVPVTLTNNLERNVDVRVELDSDRLEFPEGTVVDQTLPPGTTRLEIPVRTRTSGAFTLEVRVTSPDGSLVLDTSTFDIRSTAISGVGLVLSIGAGLFLAVWWARNWRSTRRKRRDALPPTDPGPGGEDGPGEPPGIGRRTGTAHPTPWATSTPARSARAPAADARPAGGAPGGVEPRPQPWGPTGAPDPGAPDPVPGAPAPVAPDVPTAAPATPGRRPRDPSAVPPSPPGATPTAPDGWAAPGRPAPPGPASDADGYRPAHMAPSRPGRRLPVPRRGGHPGRSR